MFTRFPSLAQSNPFFLTHTRSNHSGIHTHTHIYKLNIYIGNKIFCEFLRRLTCFALQLQNSLSLFHTHKLTQTHTNIGNKDILRILKTLYPFCNFKILSLSLSNTHTHTQTHTLFYYLVICLNESNSLMFV